MHTDGAAGRRGSKDLRAASLPVRPQETRAAWWMVLGHRSRCQGRTAVGLTGARKMPWEWEGLLITSPVRRITRSSGAESAAVPMTAEDLLQAM